ncbi:SusC/RagA family TonB-linked outer membrane protein [Agrobacterium tumefaciens]|nr:SusC/RagA family TonB-linked outer membrane protein [Agrobacterium tumefaciens]NTE26897.1 SusC/RagA family TonB-linked outer membrane protein [Agrobacterium tumefaciens]
MKKTIKIVVMALLCLNFWAVAQTIPIKLSGTVRDKAGKPIPGATIKTSEKERTTFTDKEGKFSLTIDKADGMLTISSIGHQTVNTPYGPKLTLDIILNETAGSLDDVVVIAYGTTTKKLNTGAIGKVSASEIALQPVSNPLSALQGRIPGLAITQNSGINGAGLKVQIRGQGSLMQGSEPLFIIDGIPFSPGNNSINTVTNATGSSGVSPFSTINPSEIESVEILKDADATSIYGSRGANGVILITTKKGMAGKSKLSLNIYNGYSQITRTMDMLATEDYLKMRREGFKNDGLAMTSANAPDLLLWDQTRYTNFKDILIGGNAKTTDVQSSISGGTEKTRFLISGGYHGETSVFPSEQRDDKLSGRISLNHRSTDERFSLDFSGGFLYDRNKMSSGDLTAYINMPPNMRLYDDAGNLNWQEGGTFFGGAITNPLAAANRQYTGKFSNLTTSVNMAYEILAGLKGKVSLGYNSLSGNDQALNPSSSINPNSGTLPYSNFGRSFLGSWIVEPQLEYINTLGKGKLNILAGGTLQNTNSNTLSVSAQNYRNDILLSSIAAAGNVTTSNSDYAYRYTAFYGRINYNFADKYLINLTGRRDGSSRFGPGKRFANFGALGTAWIFTGEDYIREKLSWLSFGKIRASYGTTGNDQIGNYKFLDTWTNSSLPYQGNAGLQPSSLYNADFSWETNHKAEVALELGVLKNRIMLSAAYFVNRSGNQLINYQLPIQTGFTSILRNFDAVVQNSGLEISLESTNFLSGAFKWTSNANLSIPKNKLVKFSGLDRSSYANTYIIGEPLSAKRVLEYLGVDPSTGIYSFRDVNGDGLYDASDRILIRNTQPDFYGGLQNSFSYKNIKLDIFLEFRKQIGYNYLYTQSTFIPGYFYFNQPSIVLDRWQAVGGLADIQRFVASGSSAAYAPAGSYLPASSAVFSNASFIRLKNVSLTYAFAEQWVKKLKLQQLSIYVHGQNLLTITGYKGADPESQNLFVLPPLRTITAGLQLTL